ncbi:MAG: transglycosylase SLT domain-containing protein [Burkholderiaceae bacterium]
MHNSVIRSFSAFFCLLLVLLAAPVSAQKRTPEALTPDEAFVQLRDAQRNFELDRVQALVPRIPADYPLAMYAEYWGLRVRMIDRRGEPTGQVSDAEIRAMIERYDGQFVADRLRNDWLLLLGKRRDWNLFDAELPKFVLQDDPQLVCYALLSRLTRTPATQATIGTEARELLNKSSRDAGGDGCIALTQGLAESGVWSATDLWERIRLLQEGNQLSASKKLLPLLPIDQRPEVGIVDAVWEAPLRWLAKSASIETRGERELTVLALARAARQDSEQGNAGVLRDWAQRLAKNHPRDARFMRMQVGIACAKRLGDDCAQWLRGSLDTSATEEGLEWATRAALRALDWKLVDQIYQRKPEALQAVPTWRYWYARALKAEGKADEAVPIFNALKDRFDFYGILSREELGERFTAPAKTLTFSAADVEEAAQSPHFARAFKFYQLGLRFEGNREWNWNLRGLSDSKLAAYAEFGRRSGFLDRMVNTSDRTREQLDFAQRYPTPFVEQLRPITQDLGLDLGWVYGLIRQESRFIMDAKSSAGATGLMQLMPATARYVAKKIGMDYDPNRINDMQKNLTLGSNYLSMVLADLDGSQALASAAYNAGPSRPRAWRATLTRPVEGAIFAETIPFSETRGYVKSVLANATIYSAMLTGKPQSLKARLGRVSPKEAGKTELP